MARVPVWLTATLGMTLPTELLAAAIPVVVGACEGAVVSCSDGAAVVGVVGRRVATDAALGLRLGMALGPIVVITTLGLALAIVLGATLLGLDGARVGSAVGVACVAHV